MNVENKSAEEKLSVYMEGVDALYMDSLRGIDALIERIDIIRRRLSPDILIYALHEMHKRRMKGYFEIPDDEIKTEIDLCVLTAVGRVIGIKDEDKELMIVDSIEEVEGSE